MGPTNRYSNRKHCSSRGAGIATVHSAHLPQQNCTRGVHNQSGPNYIIAGPYDWPYMINQSFHFSFLVNATPDANPKVLPGAGPVLTSFVCIVDFRSRDGCWMG